MPYALTPLARTFWKQSRQYTGFPAVGRNGTWVGWPQEEQTASWNSREGDAEIGEALGEPPD
jgi:hypothetical protein